MKKKDVYNRAKATWGIDAQITKAVEELAELQKELCKFLLDDGNMEHTTEEITDEIKQRILHEMKGKYENAQ